MSVTSGLKSIFNRHLFSLVLFAIFSTSCSSGTAMDSTTTGSGSAYPAPPASTEDLYSDRRDAMVTMNIENRDISDPDVLRAMRRMLVEYAKRHPIAAKNLMHRCGLKVDGSDEDYFVVGRDYMPFVSLSLQQ